MSSYLETYVRCPFYCSDDGSHCIRCEGITDQSNLAQNFRNKQAFLQQMMIFCTRHYDKCELHGLLMDSKYADDPAAAPRRPPVRKG